MSHSLQGVAGFYLAQKFRGGHMGEVEVATWPKFRGGGNMGEVEVLGGPKGWVWEGRGRGKLKHKLILMFP